MRRIHPLCVPYLYDLRLIALLFACYLVFMAFGIFKCVKGDPKNEYFKVLKD